MPKNGIIYTNKRGFARRTKKDRTNKNPGKIHSLFEDERWNKMQEDYDELFKEYDIYWDKIVYGDEEEVEKYVPKKRLEFYNNE